MIEAQKKAEKANMLDFIELKMNTELKTSNKSKQTPIDEIINSLLKLKQSNMNKNDNHDSANNINTYNNTNDIDIYENNGNQNSNNNLNQ